jgi:hypothetical protein
MTGIATAAASTPRVPVPATTCPACRSMSVEVFHEHEGVPIHSCRLVGSREEALGFPRGTLRLGLCRSCGFITNVAYDATLQDYSVSYEETQGFSPRFRRFADDLAHDWVARYDLRGKTILEIGCGKVEFLAEMCLAGAKRGIGVDPSIVDERVPAAVAPRIELIHDLFDERYADLEADAIVCRHTLEHIGPVGDFMELVRRCAAQTGAVILFELPDVLRVLRETAFWDVYYEHCSYFSPGSLARLFRSTGLDVLHAELAYDGQYILLEAVPGDGLGAPLAVEESADGVVDAVEGFVQSFAAAVADWRNRIAEAERAVLWGGGSKGVSFLTTLGARGEIEYVVDVNPYKQGRFMAGTGHEVIAPTQLATYRPDLVIAMNPVYVDEIRATLDGLEIDCELIAA